MVTEAKGPRSPGMRVAWVVGGAAVAGLVLGVGLSLKRQADFEEEMSDLQAQSERLMPMGAPVRFAESEVDPLAPPSAIMAWLPPYEGARPRAVVKSAATDGVPMDVAWFTTQDAPEKVQEYFRTYLQLRHHLTVANVYPSGARYVAYMYDPLHLDGGVEDGVLHMLSIVPQGRETLVLASNTRPKQLVGARKPQLPPGVVLPPGARRPQVFDVGEAPGVRVTVHASIPAGDLEVATDFYRTHLSTGGWTATEDGDGSNGMTFSASRKSELQSITLARRPGKVDVVVTWAGGF